MWIQKYGVSVEKRLTDNCYGNRLCIAEDKNSLVKGKWLYKKYIHQYHKWWNNGLQIANDTLKNNKYNINIINLDISNYYRNINFDFQILEKDIYEIDNNVDFNNIIHETLKEIHKRYWEKIKTFQLTAVKSERPLPISLPTSSLFANWFLYKLDYYIEKQYTPLYYGRYVDDIMIILPYSKLTDKITFKDNIDNILSTKLPGLFETEENNANIIKFAIKDNDINALTLNKDKIFIYDFDSELPLSVIDKFVEDQRLRSSEFRFYSDEEDDLFKDFDEINFIQIIDTLDGDSARIKQVENSKFKLSVFLAKMIHRLIDRGASYKTNEIDKIYKFFKGKNLIEYYNLWEKLFKVYSESNQTEYFYNTLKDIQNAISLLCINPNVTNNKQIEITENIKDTLYQYLTIAVALSLSYSNKNILETMPTINKGLKDKLLLKKGMYETTHYVRRHYFKYPLQEFLTHEELCNNQFSYTDYKKQNIESLKLLPYSIKFYEVYLMHFLSFLDSGNEEFCKLLDRTYKSYIKINNIKDQQTLYTEQSNKENERYLYIQDSEKKDKLSIAIVEMYIDSKDVVDKQYNLFAKEGIDEIQPNVEEYCKILDNITITKSEVFIMPELAIDILYLFRFCQYSAQNQRAFISGINYICRNRTVYNFIVTCLPLKYNNICDAIPIIRLKNYYAPKEIQNIESYNLKVPKQLNNIKINYLYRWKGHYFTTYYCYELANIKDRCQFFSKVDAIYAPVFNLDTYYFNNIVESMVRDMHCYFIQANVSQYGGSRVTRPTKHEKMDKLFVKGGTNNLNKSIVLVSDINIKKLRDFQLKSYNGQIGDKEFKPLPPDYSRDNLLVRIKNEEF